MCRLSRMILPQVHLRKPCYDFSFLQIIQFANFKKIQQSYRKIAVTPIHSPTHPIGRSDGRCVQRAGTYSVHVDDIHLLGIPSLNVKISKRDSIKRTDLRFHSPFRAKLNKLTYSSIVARALPRTSKGITDLLLLPTSSNLYKASPSKKQISYSKNCTIQQVIVSFVNGINQTNHSTN